ncbi:hypothetical protein [Streptomyces atratus]|uniref:hypothetical protein n=1 Tax=Streptomyces atratus TaxID=1893 RepID=UPI0033C26E56
MGFKRSAFTRATPVVALSVEPVATATAQGDGEGDCSDAGNICVSNHQQPTGYIYGHYDLNGTRPDGYGGKICFADRKFNYLSFYDNNNEFSSFRKTGC